MKLIALMLAICLLAPVAYAKSTYVRGYTRSDGTYVAPHYRSAPDGNRYNNYSTKGNINPYTGTTGTKSYYAPSTYNQRSYQMNELPQLRELPTLYDD